MSAMELRSRRSCPVVSGSPRGMSFKIDDKPYSVVDAIAKGYGLSAGSLGRLLVDDVGRRPDAYRGVIENVVARAREEEAARRKAAGKAA